MGKEKPEAKDGLGKNVENSIGDNFAINVQQAGTVGNTPDTMAN